MKFQLMIKYIVSIILVTLTTACAHPISIVPNKTPERDASSLSHKKAAYVMTESDRNQQITSAGGGGDKVNYYPYRDAEKSIRDALRSIYIDVVAVSSSADFDSLKANDISVIYTPVISTQSSSNSAFTWPPTYFSVELTCNVNDKEGKELSILKVSGNGHAEFSEFKVNTGLAGSRATSDLSEKLKQEILRHPELY
jgi:hypothetical protein